MKPFVHLRSASALIAIILIAAFGAFEASRLIFPPRILLPAQKAPEVPRLETAVPTPPEKYDGLYASLVDKPVFHASRKYIEPSAVATTPPSPPPDLQLAGYVSVPGRPPHAFLTDGGRVRTLSVTAGDNVDGWIVAGVSAKLVTLRQNDRRAVVFRTGTHAEANESSPESIASVETAGVGTVASPANQQSPADPSSASRSPPPMPSTSAVPAPAPSFLPSPVGTTAVSPPLTAAGNPVRKEPIAGVIAAVTLDGVLVTAHREPPAAPYLYTPPIQVESQTQPRTYSAPVATRATPP